ncbi:hypothetical protein [Microcoleus sp. PH2017_32_RDM_D_A]|uniref:hypothetical protein n=1 Tax=Microcoleus sp. PH2017_32_RDM_D_A TaxID=2798842 RepID=UPI001D921FEF|nr:hypothetical protein [Microcoleus sp. PH2017_32_RDM_D_A]MCC3578803.1 hypothetical protein [Microcoleus sp. PH2017_32_RDM_D_A]
MPIPQEKKVFVGWASCPSYFRTGKMPIPQEKKVFVGWASCPSYFRTGKMPVPQEDCGMGILPVLFLDGQDARSTRRKKVFVGWASCPS